MFDVLYLLLFEQVVSTTLCWSGLSWFSFSSLARLSCLNCRRCSIGSKELAFCFVLNVALEFGVVCRVLSLLCNRDEEDKGEEEEGEKRSEEEEEEEEEGASVSWNKSDKLNS